MIRFPWRSKIAAVVVLFFLGTFAGQARQVLDTVRGRVEDGARITGELRTTVSTLQVLDTAALEGQITELRARLAEGTATPAQVESLRALIGRLQAQTGGSGTQGAPGPPGPSGPPGPPAAEQSSATTSTTAGGTTTTSRPPTTTTTRSRPSTTTTTRCVVGVGRLLKVGC